MKKNQKQTCKERGGTYRESSTLLLNFLRRTDFWVDFYGVYIFRPRTQKLKEKLSCLQGRFTCMSCVMFAFLLSSNQIPYLNTHTGAEIIAIYSFYHLIMLNLITTFEKGILYNQMNIFFRTEPLV
jgi:hypothetical protein